MTNKKISEFIEQSSAQDNDFLPIVRGTDNFKVRISNFLLAATSLTYGSIKLAGDLGGTADSPTVPALVNKANVTSPSLGGIPTTPTPLDNTNVNQIVNIQYVTNTVAPLKVDTLAIYIDGNLKVKDYLIINSNPYSFQINSLAVTLGTGTCNYTLNNNGVALANATNLSATTTQQIITFNPVLTIPSTNNLSLSILNPLSAQDINLTIRYTRV